MGESAPAQRLEEICSPSATAGPRNPRQRSELITHRQAVPAAPAPLPSAKVPGKCAAASLTPNLLHESETSSEELLVPGARPDVEGSHERSMRTFSEGEVGEE